jgi:hypothetical protein
MLAEAVEIAAAARVVLQGPIDNDAGEDSSREEVLGYLQSQARDLKV